MINMLTVVWKPTCFYASKHFPSLSGCLVSGECLKALQQREKFMIKFKRVALWKRLHERNAKHVLSSMIELEGFWGPKEVICHGFNRVQPDLLIVGSWGLSPFQRYGQIFLGI
ncbi:hypothetical protein RHGRI_018306 [Rhododendron griersonianum]|uniref:Uncharacterized protein n=2 Tax=Rhododendron griersonianum TaxID=479676 RepID=A0AAV6K0X2_9ERIC|nr:hypothetical protein RHGRI_018306 [Rhododendron griersonianum]